MLSRRPYSTLLPALDLSLFKPFLCDMAPHDTSNGRPGDRRQPPLGTLLRMASLLCPPAFQMCEPLHACVVFPSASPNRPAKVLTRLPPPAGRRVRVPSLSRRIPWCVAKRADATFAPVY